jgi:hypothetical protein
MEKNKIQNKQSSVTSINWLCARCGNCGNWWWRVILCSWCCPGRGKCRKVGTKYCLKKSKLRYQKKLEKFTREWKPENERQSAKNDERKWSERKRNLHPLVTMDTDSLSRERYPTKNFWIMSESEVNERETFTHWKLWIQTHFLGSYWTENLDKILWIVMVIINLLLFWTYRFFW